jgi:hypothetical protein
MWKETLEVLFEVLLLHLTGEAYPPIMKKIHIYDSRSPGRDLNQGPTEYAAGTLPIRPRYSVRYLENSNRHRIQLILPLYLTQIYFMFSHCENKG